MFIYRIMSVNLIHYDDDDYYDNNSIKFFIFLCRVNS
jgi:hypothetical protein